MCKFQRPTEAGDCEFELLGTADFGEPVYATPAFVDDRIYVRGLAHLFCIGAKAR
jgi:hypothetical protein